MLTTFQKALLATLAGSALLLALVLAVRTPAVAATGGTGGFSPFGALASQIAPSNGGIAPGIVTTGDATVFVEPDLATISVGATVQADTAGNAQAQLADRIAKILAAAKAFGIPDSDVETSSYSIQPNYVYQEREAPRISGYQAQQLVTVTLRDISRAGAALDALVRDTGATNANIGFSLDDAKAAQAEARKLAIEDARAKAQAMAGAAGVGLGRVIAISDQSVGIPFKGRMELQVGAAADTQIPVGDLQIAVQVLMQFEIP